MVEEQSEQSFVSIILAGGSSRRMGQSKARLQLDQQTLVERQVELVSPFSSFIVIIVTPEDYPFFSALFAAHLQIQVITDEPNVRGEGPLAGIYTGMQEVDASYYFVLACDLIDYPKTFLGLFKEWALEQAEYEAFVPVQGAYKQPLAAIYSRQTEKVHQLITQGKKRLSDLLAQIHVCYVPEEQWRKWTELPDPFYNMNEAKEYQDLLKRRSGKE